MKVTLNNSLIPYPMVLSMHECISYLCRFANLGYLIVIELKDDFCAWIPSLRWLCSSFIIFLTLLKIVPYCFIVVEQYGCSCEHVLSCLLCLNLGIEKGQVITPRNFQVVFKSYSTTDIPISSVYECWLFNNLQLLSSTEFSMCDMVSHSHPDSYSADHLFMSMNNLGIFIFSMANVYSDSLSSFFFLKWITSCSHYSTVRVLHML